jgi:hypothetical protein
MLSKQWQMDGSTPQAMKWYGGSLYSSIHCQHVHSPFPRLLHDHIITWCSEAARPRDSSMMSTTNHLGYTHTSTKTPFQRIHSIRAQRRKDSQISGVHCALHCTRKFWYKRIGNTQNYLDVWLPCRLFFGICVRQNVNLLQSPLCDC